MDLKEEMGVGLVSLAQTALNQLEKGSEDYYKLKGMLDALELAKNHGIVISKGSPFYGMTKSQLEEEIDEIIESMGFSPEDGNKDPLRDLAEKARDLAMKYKKDMPISWQGSLLDMIDKADDLETSIIIGQRERAIRLGQELEKEYDKFLHVLGKI